MNTPEDQRITYVEVEPAKASALEASQSPLSGVNGTESGNLDKIRDILFGSQSREYEKRLNRLEERLIREYTNLRDDTKKRLDNLEIYIKQEVESITERIKNEQFQRDETVKGLTQELKSLISSLEKRLNILDEQTNTKERELRQQILDQSKSFDDEIRQKYEDILVTLEREAQELRSAKTDRSTLASLFAELAVRLNKESGISGQE